MVFRAITPDDKDWITSCRDVERHPFTALSFPSLFTWSEAYGLTVTGDEHFFAVRSLHDQGYYCPCGDEESCAAFVEALCKEEAHPRLLYLTKEQGDRLREQGWSVRLREDLSEYIGLTSALALREGHMSKSVKEKRNRFAREHPYTARMLSERDLPLLRRMTEQLGDERSLAEMGDLSVLRLELDLFSLLGLRGVLLETQDGGLAFMLGYENKPGMFTMTMTKHSPELPPQATTVCVYELARMLDGEYPLIDMEEDLGLEGLRRAKMLNCPIDRLDVYEGIKL